MGNPGISREYLIGQPECTIGQKTTVDAALHLPVTCRSNDADEKSSARPVPNVGRNCAHKSSAWDTFNEPHRSRILDGGAA